MLVALLAVAVIFSLFDILRIIVGLPFVLFFPGYVLVLALVPSRERLGNIERVALGFGLSIIVVPTIGFILNYTPWGLGVESVLVAMVSFIVLTSVIAWLRLRKLPEGRRFDFEFRLGWSGSTYNKVLSLLLAIVILTALGTVGYVIAKPRVEERFTEFYMLGSGGEVADYPGELKVGEEGKVILGIINREHETVSYRVDVMMDNVRVYQTELLELRHDEMVEEIVVLRTTKVGDNQKVEFLLYKKQESEPYSKLHLWVNVSNIQN